MPEKIVPPRSDIPRNISGLRKLFLLLSPPGKLS